MKKYGDNVVLVYGTGSIKKNGIYDDIIKILKESNKNITEIEGVMPNPTVEKLYEGCKKACGENIHIVGGDITGGDKIFVSVCAIGSTAGRNISSRKNAAIGQKVIVSGLHGSSSAGLKLLIDDKNIPEQFVKAHLEPQAQVEFGKDIATNVKEDYAMMDTSDGLMDALSTIANESNVLLDIDFDKIPHSKELENFDNWENLVLYGGEDYQIVATVPQNCPFGTTIGNVKEGIKMDGYHFGGKTGTAQKLPRSEEKYAISVISAAPIDAPQLVLYVVLDEYEGELADDGSAPVQYLSGLLFR